MKPTFSFPFDPYDIQIKFMRELYFTIENKKLGIFESPTGTGKSLSICCSALQWLKDSNEKNIEDLKTKIDEIKNELSSLKDSDDWLQEEYIKIQKNQSLLTLQTKLDKIKQKEEEINELKKRVYNQKNKIEKKDNYFLESHTKHKVSENNEKLEEKEDTREGDTTEDQDLIVEDFEGDDDESYKEDSNLNYSEDNITKVYISSRTHSQLSQFIGEVNRTVFKGITRIVTLASRQHYCINSDVSKLKNVNLINERCLDLQKSKTKSTSIGEDGKVLKRTKTNSCTVCPYYNQSNITKLKERLLVDIMDMEDLVKCGKILKACPYYATRMALDQAEIVLISHAGIVSSGARSGISLKLQDNILILDEAHGLTAALENAYSAPVSVKQLSSVKTFLDFYINKYKSRLSSKNLLQLNQLKFVVGKFIGIVNPKQFNEKQQSKIFTLEEFVINAEIDHLHLHPLVQFCRSTKLAPKLHGFSMRYNRQALEENIKVADNRKALFKDFLSNIAKKNDLKDSVKNKTETNSIVQPNVPNETSAGSGLYAILDFIEMLCDRSENGRVFVQMGDNGQLKYLLLNPAEHFAKIVSECRSVIVAGGTMEPLNEFKALLTNNSMDVENVNVVKCDHVVSPDNVLGVCLSRGPSNVHLNFSYENRSSKELLNEVGRILSNVCNIVPDGIICFLPSYSYEQTLYEHLCTSKTIDIISKKKKLLREPKSATDVDQVLQKYAGAIKNKSGSETGALLLSVVGGKLSEGLNFSDELGRCVIVIGMPYPNVKSLELQEKMKYLNKLKPGEGNTYCENLCMKAVNQCVGRAVRHINDYACVLLVDERYSRPQTISALPSFVKKSLLSSYTFGPAIGNIAKFFTRHKQKSTCK